MIYIAKDKLLDGGCGYFAFKFMFDRVLKTYTMRTLEELFHVSEKYISFDIVLDPEYLQEHINLREEAIVVLEKEISLNELKDLIPEEFL